MSQQEKPKLHWTTWGYMRTEKMKPKQVAFVEYRIYEQLQSELESVKAIYFENIESIKNDYLYEINKLESQLTAEREASKRLVEWINKYLKSNDCECGADNGTDSSILICFLHKALSEYKKARDK